MNNKRSTQEIAFAETPLAGKTETPARWNHERLKWRGKLKTNLMLADPNI
jgi:hypothetical protein